MKAGDRVRFIRDSGDIKAGEEHVLRACGPRCQGTIREHVHIEARYGSVPRWCVVPAPGTPARPTPAQDKHRAALEYIAKRGFPGASLIAMEALHGDE